MTQRKGSRALTTAEASKIKGMLKRGDHPGTIAETFEISTRRLSDIQRGREYADVVATRASRLPAAVMPPAVKHDEAAALNGHEMKPAAGKKTKRQAREEARATKNPLTAEIQSPLEMVVRLASMIVVIGGTLLPSASSIEPMTWADMVEKIKALGRALNERDPSDNRFFVP